MLTARQYGKIILIIISVLIILPVIIVSDNFVYLEAKSTRGKLTCILGLFKDMAARLNCISNEVVYILFIPRSSFLVLDASTGCWMADKSPWRAACSILRTSSLYKNNTNQLFSLVITNNKNPSFSMTIKKNKSSLFSISS